jgi:hypothetical protein
VNLDAVNLGAVSLNAVSLNAVNLDAVVVTSISGPNPVLKKLAKECSQRKIRFFVMGDTKSPSDFLLEGCEFHSLDRQRESGFRYAALCPHGSYTRKNIGYLMAIREGARVLVETDDDNDPCPEFWRERTRVVQSPRVDRAGWINVYRYFSDVEIWPRGLPLTAVRGEVPKYEQLAIRETDCPIQQGLANSNPDVDAVYRLLYPLPQSFRTDRRVALGAGVWCPFNSQNTTWWSDAFPLLYLPAHCSFRMTDIWRGLVAQRIGWANGWSILFHEPTVSQNRNEHDLMKDFKDEIPGYLMNREIANKLSALELVEGRNRIGDNLRRCYEALIELSAVGIEELGLLEAWLADLVRVT